MAIVTVEGIVHAGRLTRWDEVLSVEMTFQELEGVRHLLTLTVRSRDYHETIYPAMYQADTISELVRAHVDPVRIVENVIRLDFPATGKHSPAEQDRVPSEKQIARRRLLAYLAGAAVLVGFLNFVWYIAEASVMGGIAALERSTNGRYYVSNHGQYTEVSESAWRRNLLHGTTVLVTHPLALVGGWYLLNRIPYLTRPKRD